MMCQVCNRCYSVESYLIFMKPLWGKCYHYLHFTHEEAGAQSLSHRDHRASNFSSTWLRNNSWFERCLSAYVCSFGHVLPYPRYCYPQSVLMSSEISLCNYVYMAVFMGYGPRLHRLIFILSFFISSVHSRVSGRGSGGNVKDLLQTGKSKWSVSLAVHNGTSLKTNHCVETQQGPTSSFSLFPSILSTAPKSKVRKKDCQKPWTCSAGKLMPLDDILGLKAVDIVESCLHMSLTPEKIIPHYLLCWGNTLALSKSLSIVSND